MNIKDNLKLPFHYIFPPFLRYFTLLIAICLFAFSVYAIATKVYSDSSTIVKVFPFLIIFFAYDSLYRNLFTLNRVSFFSEYLQLSFLAKKKIVIKWEDIVKIDNNLNKKRFFIIHYKQGEVEKQFALQMSFPNVIDILNFIKIFAPHIETDELVSSLMFVLKDDITKINSSG